jgi:hypothetical protein
MSDFAKRVEDDINRKQREETQRLEATESAAQTAAQVVEAQRDRQRQAAIDKKAAEENEIRLVRRSPAYRGIVQSKKLQEALKFIWTTLHPNKEWWEEIPTPQLTWWQKVRGVIPQAPQRIHHVYTYPFKPTFEEIVEEGGLTLIIKLNLIASSATKYHTSRYASFRSDVWLICEFRLCWDRSQIDKDISVEISTIGIRSLVGKEREEERHHYFDNPQSDGSWKSPVHYKAKVKYEESDLIEFKDLDEMITQLSTWVSEYIHSQRLPYRFLVPARHWKNT